jgi:hypothetical protein
MALLQAAEKLEICANEDASLHGKADARLLEWAEPRGYGDGLNSGALQ